MKKSLSEKLADNLAYYINKPERRCIDGADGCYYSGESLAHQGKKTSGCFVGRLLSPQDRMKADKSLDEIASGNTTVEGLVMSADELGIKIPKIISDNVSVMMKFQFLHDTPDFWDEKGLKEGGKTMLINIIKDYELEKKYFDKFLVD